MAAASLPVNVSSWILIGSWVFFLFLFLGPAVRKVVLVLCTEILQNRENDIMTSVFPFQSQSTHSHSFVQVKVDHDLFERRRTRRRRKERQTKQERKREREILPSPPHTQKGWPASPTSTSSTTGSQVVVSSSSSSSK